jgi:hypothetical protein
MVNGREAIPLLPIICTSLKKDKESEQLNAVFYSSLYLYEKDLDYTILR